MSASTPGGADALPFDRAELMARVESDLELLSTLVGIFKADSPNLMGAIENALDAKDAEALAAAAHTMKGAVSVFGVEPARSIAEQLENRGRQGQLGDGPELFARLEEALVVAEEGLERFLRELQ